MIETIKDLVKYCFYKYEGKINFKFNECWEIEEDKNISEKLKIKLRMICPDLFEEAEE